MKRSAFTAKESPPEPIVPEYLVQTIAERVDKDGKIIVALNEGDVVKSAEFFSRHEVEAIAVNLMFSFKNPKHEVRVKEIIEKQLPGVYLSLSHRVLPQVRMYERGSTTVFNGCVGPLLKKYIDDLQLRLRKS